VLRKLTITHAINRFNQVVLDLFRSLITRRDPRTHDSPA